MHALLAIAAIAFQAPQAATPFQVSVSAAAFELCPGLAVGQVSGDSTAFLAARGFRRNRSAEDGLLPSHPAIGRPVMFVAGSVESTILVVYWPQSHFCNLSFTGPEAEAAMTALKAQMMADRANFSPVRSGIFRARSGARHTLVTSRRPLADDQSRTFTVTFEPVN